MNFHEIVSEVLGRLQPRYPSARSSLERLGDGAGTWDLRGLQGSLEKIVDEGLRFINEFPGCEMILRSDGRKADEVSLEVELSGRDITADVDLRSAASAEGRSDELGPRVALRLPRGART